MEDPPPSFLSSPVFNRARQLRTRPFTPGTFLCRHPLPLFGVTYAERRPVVALDPARNGPLCDSCSVQGVPFRPDTPPRA